MQTADDRLYIVRQLFLDWSSVQKGRPYDVGRQRDDYGYSLIHTMRFIIFKKKKNNYHL
jgi:hypothetical protein